VLFQKEGNYQAINNYKLNATKTKGILIEVEHPSTDVPASIFEILCR